MDREKVIRHIKAEIEIAKLCKKDFASVDIDMLSDAYELLKEQEAVEPRVSTAEQRCGHCNYVLELDGWIACPWCGKRIDWESWWSKNGNR
jgi:hypothetical protein